MPSKFDFKKINWPSAMIMLVIFVLLTPGLFVTVAGPSGKLVNFGFEKAFLAPGVIHGVLAVLLYEIFSQIAGYQTVKA